MNYLYLRIRCMFGKHGRGKRIAHIAHVAGGLSGRGFDTYRYVCPHCGTAWERTVKAKA